MITKALNYIWASLPWVSFFLFLESCLLFFTGKDYWVVSSLGSIYCLVLYRVLPKTGW